MKNTTSANNSTIQDTKMYYNIKIEDYNTILADIPQTGIIFLCAQIGMGKTTISQCILRQLLHHSLAITSPTYTYYNIYDTLHYHFDLYRLADYEEFIHIGGEEILKNNQNGIILVEWPELIESYIEPDICIYITQGDAPDLRNIKITTLQYLS